MALGRITAALWLCVALHGIFHMQQIKRDEPAMAETQTAAAACDATSHLSLSSRRQAQGNQVALDQCSVCLHDGLPLARSPLSRSLRRGEGITPAHCSPPAHSGLQTCLGKTPTRSRSHLLGNNSHHPCPCSAEDGQEQVPEGPGTGL